MPISNFLRDKNDLGFIATFGIPEDQFSTVNILGDEFTSLTLMLPRAISSSMRRFLGFVVLKMISSTTSFSRIVQWAILAGLNSFLSIGVLEGF
jgi:hypothetical protein